MYNDTRISVSGFLGNDPDVYENEDGKQALVFSIGVTARRWSREENRMEDGETMWYSVRAYDTLAQNAAESLKKGTPVLVRGRLATRAWKDESGMEHTRHVIIAENIGIDLKTGTATFTKKHRLHQPEATQAEGN